MRRAESTHTHRQTPQREHTQATTMAPRKQQQQLRDWAALPPEVLQQCWAFLEQKKHKRAVQRTCVAWARALLHGATRARLRLNAQDLPYHLAPRARTLQRLWGAEQLGGATLVLAPSREERYDIGGPQSFLKAGVRLPCVSRLELQVRAQWRLRARQLQARQSVQHRR